MKSDQVYVIHIRECIERIERYTSQGREAFSNETMAQDAVLRNLHVMAESMLHLSKAFRTRFSDIDWRAIAGFRNVIVHDYLGLDLKQIWDIVEGDLPELKRIFFSLDREGNQ